MHDERSPDGRFRPGPDAGSAADAVVATEIDREIRRYESSPRFSLEFARLTFSPAMEAVYERDTRPARIAVIRLITALGLVFFSLTATTDPAFVPDLHGAGVPMRLPAIAFGILVFLIVGRMTPRQNQTLVLLHSVISLLTLICIPVASQAPSAPYAFTTVGLAMIYSSLVMNFRMAQGGLGALVCLPPFLVAIVLHPAVAPEAIFAIGLQAVVSVAVGITARYGIERNARLSYLLKSRESARLSMVAAERERFATLSCTDGLTGLANRGHFDRSLDGLLSGLGPDDRGFALVMIDVDHFKRYNDFYGHVAGDACLRAVAQVLTTVTRGEDDLAARFGGEEFALLLPATTRDEAAAIAQRLCAVVAARAIPHANRDDAAGVVTISVGVAHAERGCGSTADALIERADRALYAAKSRGRNCVVARLPEAA